MNEATVQQPQPQQQQAPAAQPEIKSTTDIMAALEKEGVKAQPDPVRDEMGNIQPPKVESAKPAETPTVKDAAKPAEVPAGPQPWKDGELEYKPEELRKALETVKRVHDYDAKNTNRAKELSRIENALDPVFKLAEIASLDAEKFSVIRDAWESEFGSEAAKHFEALKGVKRSEIKDPRDEEYSKREAAIQAREDRLKFSDVVKDLTTRHGLTTDEVKEFDAFLTEYYGKDSATALDLLESPDDVFRLSPVYEKKVTAKAQAEAEAKAQEQFKREKAALEAQQNNPPRQQAGAGGENEPQTLEQLKRDLLATVPQQ